ncbi:MAG: hypothetical protein D3910_10350 [Candidatus Electrothrix sp. ATG2]|nr:hypothetical protein [Candidatus Electrothrix sp. ATG2]
MDSNDVLRFKKLLKGGERLSPSPKDKREQCARWGCLLPICFLFILLIVTAYQVNKKRTARDFCRAAERDAYAIAATLADYFIIPSHTSIGSLPIAVGPGPTTRNGIGFPALSGKNVGAINGDINKIIILVSDSSGRCMMSYQKKNAGWNGVAGEGVFTKILD